MSAQWGDVPTWVGAILTSGSVFAAYIALRRTQRQAERRQADHVHVVEYKGTVTIHNRSTAPIYLPQLGRARYKRREYRRRIPELVARANGPVPSHLLNGYKMIPDRSHLEWLKVPVPSHRKWLRVPVLISRKRLEKPISITIGDLKKENADHYVALFRDASGRHWLRSSAGDTIRTDWRNVYWPPMDVGKPEQVKDD